MSVAILSLLAVPLVYGLQTTALMNDATAVATVGVAVLVGFPLLAYSVIFRHMPASQYDSYMLWFSLFAFTSVVDLLLALQIDGRINWMGW
jgi:hypothetical protein